MQLVKRCPANSGLTMSVTGHGDLTPPLGSQGRLDNDDDPPELPGGPSGPPSEPPDEDDSDDDDDDPRRRDGGTDPPPSAQTDSTQQMEDDESEIDEELGASFVGDGLYKQEETTLASVSGNDTGILELEIAQINGSVVTFALTHAPLPPGAPVIPATQSEIPSATVSWVKDSGKRQLTHMHSIPAPVQVRTLPMRTLRVLVRNVVLVLGGLFHVYVVWIS